MSITYMLTKDATLRYVVDGATDDYGQPSQTITNVDTKCYYRVTSTTIGDTVYREDSELTVIVPAETEVDGLFGMAIDNTDYQISGVPRFQWNPRLQRAEYLVLDVRRAA